MSPHSSNFSAWEDNTSTTSNNESVLRETKELQAESMAALARIQERTAECKATGNATLDQLYDQSKTLGKSQARTIELESKLNKAHKQQDKFAKIAFRFGTKRRAKKQVKKELKVEAAMASAAAAVATAASPTTRNQATFKRKGPRPKKDTQEDLSAKAHIERNELFSEHLSRQPFQQKKSSGDSASQSPLTEMNRRDLCDIEANDRILDRGIDVLGTEVSELLALSKTINEVSHEQTTKIETIETNLENTKTQTRMLNKRLGILTKKKKKRR
eukprot:CAMPEP_0116138470 /NCGR_PEP_ID=MMETSP0329-20121206/12800_1 /TAXON_ID=697910 /ORGANISM="Pseudo-nitzschia arenysensis, Strain B593" /LENGTH=272 /DNA_ID=CAMNT_0003633457 /DNA_START=18 /DNA_END=836 /DNA_ORIENTATION=+